jgi:hypothetical protein
MLLSIHHLLPHCGATCDDFVSDHFAAFHHEADAFQFGNVRNGITREGDEIRLDRADAVLRPHHLGSIDGDSTIQVT